MSIDQVPSVYVQTENLAYCLENPPRDKRNQRKGSWIVCVDLLFLTQELARRVKLEIVLTVNVPPLQLHWSIASQPWTAWSRMDPKRVPPTHTADRAKWERRVNFLRELRLPHTERNKREVYTAVVYLGHLSKSCVPRRIRYYDWEP